MSPKPVQTYFNFSSLFISVVTISFKMLLHLFTITLTSTIYITISSTVQVRSIIFKLGATRSPRLLLYCPVSRTIILEASRYVQTGTQFIYHYHDLHRLKHCFKYRQNIYKHRQVNNKEASVPSFSRSFKTHT